MKLFIIFAHPSSKGFSHQITAACAAKKGESEIMNLYIDE